jgi:SAM-dependent methyltransferase
VGAVLRALHVNHESRVLDWGCGTGLGLDLLAGRFGKYTGIDCSPAMLREAADAWQQSLAAEQRHSVNLLLKDFNTAPELMPVMWDSYTHALSIFGSPSYLASGDLADLLRPFASGTAFLLMPYASVSGVPLLTQRRERGDIAGNSLPCWVYDVATIENQLKPLTRTLNIQGLNYTYYNKQEFAESRAERIWQAACNFVGEYRRPNFCEYLIAYGVKA